MASYKLVLIKTKQIKTNPKLVNKLSGDTTIHIPVPKIKKSVFLSFMKTFMLFIVEFDTVRCHFFPLAKLNYYG